MERVDFEEIETEYTKGGSPIYTWKGEPFTGIAYILDDAGKIAKETSYVDGIEDGIETMWYSNGQIETIRGIKWNRPHGKFQYWYEDGKIKLEGVCDLGHVIERKQWNQDGDLIEDYNIENFPERYQDFLTEKEIFDRYGIT
jgi:antitoxin component YwqK of YwqJK toxin-antitoxin module